MELDQTPNSPKDGTQKSKRVRNENERKGKISMTYQE